MSEQIEFTMDGVNALPLRKPLTEQERREYKDKYNKKRYQEKREKMLEICKKYRQENREKLREKQMKYRRDNIELLFKKRKKYNKNLKNLVVEKMGKKCIKCGFNDSRALQIDHINGGGTKELRSIGSKAIYRRILKMSINEMNNKYQLLCANCNWIKRYENDENRKVKAIL
jgi:hypothetical protein